MKKAFKPVTEVMALLWTERWWGAPSPDILVGHLVPQVMGFGGGASGRRSGYEGRAPGGDSFPLPAREDAARSAVPCRHLVLAFSLQSRAIEMLCL